MKPKVGTVENNSRWLHVLMGDYSGQYYSQRIGSNEKITFKQFYTYMNKVDNPNQVRTDYADILSAPNINLSHRTNQTTRRHVSSAPHAITLSAPSKKILKICITMNGHGELSSSSVPHTWEQFIDNNVISKLNVISTRVCNVVTSFPQLRFVRQDRLFELHPKINMSAKEIKRHMQFLISNSSLAMGQNILSPALKAKRTIANLYRDTGFTNERNNVIRQIEDESKYIHIKPTGDDVGNTQIIPTKRNVKDLQVKWFPVFTSDEWTTGFLYMFPILEKYGIDPVDIANKSTCIIEYKLNDLVKSNFHAFEYDNIYADNAIIEVIKIVTADKEVANQYDEIEVIFIDTSCSMTDDYNEPVVAHGVSMRRPTQSNLSTSYYPMEIKHKPPIVYKIDPTSTVKLDKGGKRTRKKRTHKLILKN